MRFSVKVAAAVITAASLLGVSIHASNANPPAKTQTRKAKTPPPPSVQDQIEALRQQMQSQIDSLKSDMAQKDAQLKQAQQAAADAQAAAARAQAAADAQQTAFTQNQQAVSTLASTVDDVKNAQALAVGDLADQTAAIRKEIATPEGINYKGVTLSPAGSFIAAETTWRSGATAGDVNTPFTGVPLEHSQAAQMSEFFGTGRQSRIALKATGRLSGVTFTGYYEADWLSAGVTSNNNQSNSYTMRQRQIWADARLANGWDFSGGTGWSLAAETTSGLTRGTEILPATIDAQYEAGFVWTRQYSFRVSKNIGKKIFVGGSVENPETLNPAGQNLPTNLLIGSAGTGGGLYNLNANYSFNYAPDLVLKAAYEPGWGHWEVFGIGRFFRDRIYPTSGTPYNDNEMGGGIGGGFRGPILDKKVTIGLKGLWGQGVGRYGSSTIADVTIRPDGTLSPLHGFSSLSTVEVNPNPRLNMYFNYGGDYISRDYVQNGATQVGYGTYSVNMAGCQTEPASSSANPGTAPITPSNCGANNKDVQELTAGYWFNFYNGSKGRLRQGITYANIRRDLWSGNGGTTNPGGGAHGIDNMVFTSFRYYLP